MEEMIIVYVIIFILGISSYFKKRIVSFCLDAKHDPDAEFITANKAPFAELLVDGENTIVAARSAAVKGLLASCQTGGNPFRIIRQ